MQTTISEIIAELEKFAPLDLQENYDNSGLAVGNSNEICRGVLVCLDITMEIINEAKNLSCNLIVSHHPLLFGGLKNIKYSTCEGRILIDAIKNDIALYSIHTNFDNILDGTNGKVAEIFNLTNTEVLVSRKNSLGKLFFYVPSSHLEQVKKAVFKAGGGTIGNYSECSFNILGEGEFKPASTSTPFVGEKNKLHIEKEFKVEIIYPKHLEKKIEQSLIKSHPYQEVAYDLINIENKNSSIGSGIIGSLPQKMETGAFLNMLSEKLNLENFRYSALIKKEVEKVAFCGGAGSGLIDIAKIKNADIYISSDLKYHDYFKADDKIILVDINHYESEIHVTEMIKDLLIKKFDKFAVFVTRINTNPIFHFQ